MRYLFGRIGRMVKQITYLLKRISYFLGQMFNDILMVDGLLMTFNSLLFRYYRKTK